MTFRDFQKSFIYILLKHNFITSERNVVLKIVCKRLCTLDFKSMVFSQILFVFFNHFYFPGNCSYLQAIERKYFKFQVFIFSQELLISIIL